MAIDRLPTAAISSIQARKTDGPHESFRNVLKEVLMNNRIRWGVWQVD
jgi:hypothetical protein